ncbi:MAG: type II/IV secretion system protein [Fibrobacteria bacterium]|nr:type II/IV secretion system protein [Fibrobacteria bacterium]
MEKTEVDIELSLELGKNFCVSSKCYPIGLSNDGYEIAVAKYDELLLEALQLRTEKNIRLIELETRTFESQLKKIAESSGHSLGDQFKNLDKSEIAIGDENSVEELRKKSNIEPVVKLVNEIIDRAVSEGATDIHIESVEKAVKVRFRKDGMLRKALELPVWVQAPLVSRIKVLAELDIAEKRIPHDGRIKWMNSGEAVDLRVSTLPTRLGEKVVLRVLKHAFYVSRLDSLGMQQTIYKAIQEIVNKPQGMFFVTGPTGSGKTSSLYAALREIVSKDINISTIEDPIEYRMDGANQVQVNEKAGLTFASALRSLLRQDPDVILVGEIRDEETAEIAVRAAQTGHLVFATLHTNDAISAVTRLRDLKIKPFLISSTVLGIMAQRLVRKVCPECHVMEAPTKEELLFMSDLPDLCPKAVGCKSCGFTGYSGRTGVFEMLQMNNRIKEAILNEEGEHKIKEYSGMRTLLLDGFTKIKEGLTTPAELMRVAMSEE